MELIAIVACTVSLVLVGVLVAVLRRPNGGERDADVRLLVREEMQGVVAHVRAEFTAQRSELADQYSRGQVEAGMRLEAMAASWSEDSLRDRESRQKSADGLRTNVDSALREIADKLHSASQDALRAQGVLKTAVEDRFDALRQQNDDKLEQVRATVEKLQSSLNDALAANGDRIDTLTASNTRKLAELQVALREELDRLRAGNEAKHAELVKALRDELDKLRAGNEAKLEQMRETVDEKLQGTLEKRLGESFALVSERLEQVQTGLGEMKNLANDVGGLKRVLTNVKSRGTWGEVQLARQLEDLLTPEQYEQNVAIKPASRENVEFAVKLPGRDEGGRPVYLPIDSKFPQEDYDRLLEALDLGEKTAIDNATAALERAVLAQGKTISEKYIEPPFSTDFAIMYLPTEGLFAEVVRRPGLVNKLQQDHRVMITGPSTLAMLLNSLQMGFRTLAIEKRSSEVWQVLASAKAEFAKYGKVWEKLEKQLQTAQNTVSEAGTRTRAVERKLRSVETTEVTAGEELKVVEGLFPDDDEDMALDKAS